MLSFPNCKINLGLHVTTRRPDGYHNIESVLYPVALTDALEFIVHDTLQLELYGSSVPGNIQDNIVLKAYHLVKNDHPQLPFLKIALLKNIPSGAGLGGGSADGAEMLKMLNTNFELNLSEKDLLEYASQLGSDCPFFIRNRPALATGRGELLTDRAVDLSGYTIIIVDPGIHVATAKAFSLISPAQARECLADITVRDISTWKETLINDFEKPIFDLYPEINGIKDKLYELGAIYSAMSGSGSSVFAIFPRGENTSRLNDQFKDYRVYMC